MPKYGLISETDALCIEKVIDNTCKEFKDDVINVLELGVYGGDTGLGIINYINSKNRTGFITGIDNSRDGETVRFKYNQLICGNTNEVHHKIENTSQHIIFFDACHCFTCVVSDFYAYAQKLKYNGYLIFHDTGKHIKPFTSFQHGDIDNPDAYISVRKALDNILELESHHYFTRSRRFGRHNWHIRMDEADVYNEMGGMIVLQKSY